MNCKRLFVLIMILISMSLSAATITDQLLEAMKSADKTDLLQINIRMTDQYDVQELYQATRGMTKAQKRDYVVSELKAFASYHQSGLMSQLKSTTSRVSDINALWITNVINCRATSELIHQIALRPDVKSIDLDEMRKMIDDRERENSVRVPGQPATREITWNVSHVGATDVWALGYNGSGVTVAVIDTGVNYNHQDLQDHMWTNASYPYHGYDFINVDNNPMDDDGHGTHCAGTVAGDGTAGSQTGVAPEATIMALKVLDSSGSGTESGVWNAIQFAVDHSADLISMSLGWQHSWGVDRESWRDSFNNVLAAGMVASVAAGNEGDEQSSYPIPDNVRTPGDCPPPWLNPDQTLTGGLSSVICVGATDSSDDLAYFSSHGPCTWEDESAYGDYAYNSGSSLGLIRPDISAPGYNIKSLDYANTSGYADGWNGTSMATPCNAGVIALMLSKNPNLTAAEIDQILEENAVILASSKNNDFGAGRVNALAAINAVPFGTDPPNAATNPNPSNSSTTIGIPNVLSWSNGGGASSYTVYIGTNNGSPWNIVDGQATTSPYISNPGLSYDTTYYWKVDSHNSNGDAGGTIWSFTTGSPADEDFETGDFSSWDWSLTGNAQWTIDSDNSYAGSYSAKSGPITHSQISTMSLTVFCSESGSVSFYKKVSSEASYDYLRFYIDDVQQGQWCGEVDWSYESYYVNSSGNHTFKWAYNKDASEDNGSDCAWVDFINFPPTETVPAQISYSPTSLAFGNVEVGETSVLSFQITNTGGEYLSGSMSTPIGYTVATAVRNPDERNVAGFAIPGGGSVNYNLTFAPTSATSYNDNITITSNDPDNPTCYLALTGSGVNPADITYTPSSFTQSILIGEAEDHALTIGNDGGVTLNYNVSFATGGRNRNDLLNETFDSSIPTTWTVVDGGSTTDTWVYTTAYGTSSTLDGTPFAFVDSDGAGEGVTMDEELISPAIDCTGYTNLILDFDHYFHYITGYGDEQADVDIWDGSTWNNIWASGSADVGSWTSPDHQSIDITAYANDELRVRFHYYDAVYDYYWAVDNVVITGDQSGPQWLTLDDGDSASGSIISGGADVDVTVGFDASELSLGTYTATIYISSNDPDEASVEIPVSLEVTDTPLEQEIAVTPASIEVSLLNGNTDEKIVTIANEGGLDLTWSAEVTEVSSRSTNLTDFDSGLPTTWTIYDYGVAGITWTNVSGYNGNSFDGTNFMLVNSSALPAGYTLFEVLESPVYNTEGASQISLELDHLFLMRTNEFAQISVYDGSDWQDIVTWNSTQGVDFNNFEHPIFDISEYANANMQIRFMYNDFNNQGFYWAIDNVMLSIDENIEWLTLNGSSSVSGTIPSGDPAVSITAAIDATGMPEGDYYKNITITSNDSDEGTVIVPVTMHVMAEMEPEIAVNPASIAFGEVIIGQSDTQQFTIENTGLATLNGSITTPDGYTVTQATRTNAAVRLGSKSRNTVTFSVAAGSILTYNLTFEPVDEQAYNGNVVIANNAGDDETIAITGTGIVPPTAAITWDPASFSATQETDLQTSQNLTIGNDGSLELTYTAAIQYPTRNRTDLVNETFDSGMPTDWTVTDGGATTDTWVVVDYYNSSYSLDGTPFAFIDSDGAGSVDMDEILATPVLDVEGYTSLTLEFDHYFNSYQAEIADVDVWDGTQWVNLLSMTGSDVGAWNSPSHAVYDLTSYVNDALQVRYHYYAANYEWYWAIDNVMIYGEGGSIEPTWLTLNNGVSVDGTISVGGADDVISVGFDSNGLAVGSYTANIILTSNDPDHASEAIPVTLTVDELVPDISASPLSFEYTMEPDMIDQGTIQLMNLDEGALSWTATVSNTTRTLVDAGFSEFFSSSTLDGQSDALASTSRRLDYSGIRAQGDLLMQIDLNAPTGSVLLIGNEVMNGYIWATAGGLSSSSGESNYLYHFDTSGNLLNTYTQITTSEWGFRDMADDGTYLYAGDENGFYRINPSDGSQTMLFSGNLGLTCFRSLSYVPSLGFVSGNWNNTFGNFIVFDESGNILDELTFPSTLSNVYGSTYDPSDHTLWLSDSSGPNSYQTLTFYQYDIATEALTGESIVVPLLNGSTTAQTAGGCSLSTDLIPGKVALCGVAQTDPDTFFAMELHESPTWIQITTGDSGSLPGYGGPGEIIFEINTADMIDSETHTADIIISSNDPDEPTITIPVSLNIVTYPDFNLTPSSLDFGDVAVQLSETQQFTIENNGSAPMLGTITTIAGYTVSEITTTRTTSARKESGSATIERNSLDYNIPAFSSQTFDLTFEPEAEQTYAGNIIITSNDTNYPSNLLAVTGTGIHVDFPEITVTPQALSYTLDPDATMNKSFYISNSGDGLLTYTIADGEVTTLSTLEAALSSENNLRQNLQRTDWLSFTPETGSVEVGGQQAIIVTVNTAGMTAGNYVSTIEVQSDDPNEPIVEVTINVHVNFMPEMVDDLSIQIASNTAYLTWSTTTYATSYVIYASGSPDGPFTQVGQTNITVWSTTVTETSRYFIVKAKN